MDVETHHATQEMYKNYPNCESWYNVRADILLLKSSAPFKGTFY